MCGPEDSVLSVSATFWQRLTRAVCAVLGVTIAFHVTMYACHPVTFLSSYRFLQALYDISLSKRYDFVMTNHVIKYILPYNSAMERLINYCIF